MYKSTTLGGPTHVVFYRVIKICSLIDHDRIQAADYNLGKEVD